MRKFSIYEMFNIVLVCLFLSFFSTSSHTIFSYIGYGFMGILYMLSALGILNDIIAGINNRVFIAGTFVFVTVCVFLMNSNLSLESITNVIQLICIYIWVRFAQKLDLRKVNIRRLTGLNLFLMMLLYIMAGIRLYIGYDIMFHNYASIAPLALCMIVINFAFSKLFFEYKAINYLAYTPLLILCRGRNAIVCLIIFFVYYKFINIRTKKQKFIVFFLLVLIIYTVTIQYPLLYHTEIGNKLNALSFAYTHKYFFTGRQLIWRNILDVMKDHELLGYGTGTLYGTFFNDQRSAHNQYIQLYMQNGIIGIFILGIILYFIFSSIVKNKINVNCGTYEYSLCKISESFFVIMLIYNIFSVAMLQNSMVTANFFWFISTIGISNNVIPKQDS